MPKKKIKQKIKLPSIKSMIFAIVIIALGLILFLGLVDKGGQGGDFIAKYAERLFGFGVYFAPLILVGAGFFIFSSRRWHWLKALGVLVFGLSTLGLLDLVSSASGGLIGAYTVGALKKVFDFWGSFVLLSCVFLISVLSTFSFPYTLLAKLKQAKTKKSKRKDKKEKEEGQEGEEQKTVLTKHPIFKLSKGQKEKGSKEEQKQKSEANEKEEVASSTEEAQEYIPSKDFLSDSKAGKRPTSRSEIKNAKATIKETFENFNIQVKMDEVNVGPTVTQYTFEPEQGVKLSKIESYQKDLSMALASHPLRLEAPIPGRSLVGVEVPNQKRQEVRLKQMLEKKEFKKTDSKLTIPFGLNVSGEPTFANLEKMPHLLIAGATGSGKSVCIHNIITSFLYQNSPQTLRFIMADPKRVELTAYDGIPHLLTPVIDKPKKVINALKWAVSEMERRYDFLSETKARNIESLNKKLKKSESVRSFAEEEGLLQAGDEVPYIVIIIDELADIMSQFGNEMESVVVRLAQMARAVGIHLILSTQRPSVEVITGLIKANITSRIAFQVASQVDSRTILDRAGADKLLGDGDMLYLAGDSQEPQRVQGVFVSESEVKRVVKYLKKQPSLESLADNKKRKPAAKKRSGLRREIKDYKEKELEDELYPDAKEIVIKAGKGSASLLQRKLRIGYARAARLLDMMEEEGIVGPARGSKARKVTVDKNEFSFD